MRQGNRAQFNRMLRFRVAAQAFTVVGKLIRLSLRPSESSSIIIFNTTVPATTNVLCNHFAAALGGSIWYGEARRKEKADEKAAKAKVLRDQEFDKSMKLAEAATSAETTG